MTAEQIMTGNQHADARSERSADGTIESVLREKELDALVQSLDPLHADAVFTELPLWNERGAVDEIAQAARTLASNTDAIANFTLPEARAALRDLGFLAASLRRHEVPMDRSPELEAALTILGQKTGEAPRDTVFSYGPRNPNDSRQRRFVTIPEEKVFITSFSEGMSGLYEGLAALMEAYNIGPMDPLYRTKIQFARDGFKRMTDAIQEVRRVITPEVFTNTLRPYFDPVTINGTVYVAPGGAQMPVILFDQIIWGSDSDNATYREYKTDNIRYSPPSVQALSAALDGHESLVSQIERASQEGTNDSRESAAALLDLLNGLLRFRSPHLKVAKDNFALRASSAVGSGGYPVDILEFLIDQTNAARERLRKVSAA